MASKYIQKFPVPKDFPEILHDLAKEILRDQPEDIVEFSALYFKCLQEKIVLDYPKKGKNIPSDFKASVPKTSTKEDLDKNKRKVTRGDEEDHMKALGRLEQKDAAHVRQNEMEEMGVNTKANEHLNTEQKQLQREMDLKKSTEELASLTSSFVDEVMNKKLGEYKSKI